MSREELYIETVAIDASIPNMHYTYPTYHAYISTFDDVAELVEAARKQAEYNGQTLLSLDVYAITHDGACTKQLCSIPL